jgi:dUTP pyrophosphatase
MFVRLLSETSKVPMRMSEGAAGYDIYSNEDTIIKSQNRKLISTGISIEIPDNVYGQIAPRSSLAIKEIDVGAGIIDSDYRGEVKVLLINNSVNDFVVKKGDRISQLILKMIYTPEIKIVEHLSKSERNDGGFGSTNNIKDICHR